MFLCAVNCCWNSVLAVGGVPGARRGADELVGPVGEQRVEHGDVALGEQGRVVVRGRALHDQDVRLADAPGGGAGLEALADQRADLDVVEAHVVLAAAAEGQAVVVDDGDAVGLGVGLDPAPDPGVERVHDEHAGALGNGFLGVGELGGIAALRILHGELRGRKTGQRQGLGQVWCVEFGVPGRGDGVREDHGYVALALGRERLQAGHRREGPVERAHRDRRRRSAAGTAELELELELLLALEDEELLQAAAARHTASDTDATAAPFLATRIIKTTSRLLRNGPRSRPERHALLTR